MSNRPDNPVEGDTYTDDDGIVWEYVEHTYDDKGHWTRGKRWECVVCGYVGHGVPTTKVLARGSGFAGTGGPLVPVCGYDRCANLGPDQRKAKEARLKVGQGG